MKNLIMHSFNQLKAFLTLIIFKKKKCIDGNFFCFIFKKLINELALII